MSGVKCYRISPAKINWSHTGNSSRLARELFVSTLVRLQEHQATAASDFQIPVNTLLLLSAGVLTFSNGDQLTIGDLYWNTVPDVSVSLAAGTTVYTIETLQGTGSGMASQRIRSATLPWENFDDPAGRPTQPVQVLLDGEVSALRTRFDPEYTAGEHWHDFDTLYFISDGSMQFGDEGWFELGDIRAVHGGHSYGPERPGTLGVEFVLISLGGPVALHWSDLEPPP